MGWLPSPPQKISPTPLLLLQSRNMDLIVALGGKTSVINSINLSANKFDFEQGWEGMSLPSNPYFEA